MANNQAGQETLGTGWDIIPHPSFNQEAASEGTEGQSIPAIEAVPISFFNPEPVNNSSKRRRRDIGYELLEILDNDFTLVEVFKSNTIEEVNHGREIPFDAQEVLTNLKGWKIERRMRVENNGKGRVDKIYRHPRSKKVLRSLKKVMEFIQDNSCLRQAFVTGEGISQDPCVNVSSIGSNLFPDPNVTIPSAGGDLFQDPNVFSSPAGELFQDPYFKFSSLGSEYFQDPNLNFYPSSGNDMLQDRLRCMNPKSLFHLNVYASMIEGYSQQPQVVGSSRGYNPATDRSSLAGMASSSSAHLQPQSQQPLYTQRQVDDMLEAQRRAMAEEVCALEEQNRVAQTFLRSSGITLPPTLGSRITNQERR